MTNVGERVNQPDFGSRLRAICFEPDNRDLPQKLEAEILRTVGLWLPYINIIEVNTLQDAADKNQVVVSIKYSTTLNPETLQAITVDAGYTATTY